MNRLHSLQTEVLAVTAIAASQFEGEDAAALGALRADEESTPVFLHLQARLQHIRDAHEDIIIVYTMRHTDDAVRIIVDADYGKKDVQRTGIDAPYGRCHPPCCVGLPSLPWMMTSIPTSGALSCPPTLR